MKLTTQMALFKLTMLGWKRAGRFDYGIVYKKGSKIQVVGKYGFAFTYQERR